MQTIDPREEMPRYVRVLTVAGSEPLGSAGIQADIKAISACGAYASGAVTCIVDEDTLHVKSVNPLPVELVTGQIRSVLGDVGADAVKIGFLPSAAMIRAVAETLKSFGPLNLVVDPVMVTSSGDRMTDNAAAEAMKEFLFPLATIITPNLREAALLLGTDPEAAWEARCRNLTAWGCSALLKSTPLAEEALQDLLCNEQTGHITAYTKQRIVTRNINGTGCTLSSAIAAYLAHGFGLEEAVRLAEEYIHGAILSGAKYRFGAGFGPVDHLYRVRKCVPIPHEQD